MRLPSRVLLRCPLSGERLETSSGGLFASAVAAHGQVCFAVSSTGGLAVELARGEHQSARAIVSQPQSSVSRKAPSRESSVVLTGVPVVPFSVRNVGTQMLICRVRISVVRVPSTTTPFQALLTILRLSGSWVFWGAALPPSSDERVAPCPVEVLAPGTHLM